MPNWVYTTITVSGDEKLLADFKKQANKTPPTFSEKSGDDVEPILSFGNFIAPPQEAIDSGEYHGTHGWQDGKQVGNTDYNWYNWNVDNWGTKWDACDTELEELSASTAHYRLNTAWSPAEPVFRAMVEQHPKLTFEIFYEEEQGWGGKLFGENGELSITDEWDVPDSHKDYVDRDREDSCICSWDDEVENWYDDCPKPDGKQFEVVLSRTLVVTARDIEHAKDLVEEALSEATPIERRAMGDKDPYTITELDNGVEMSVQESEETA